MFKNHSPHLVRMYRFQFLQVMVDVCTKIGITNYEEYSLVRDGPSMDDSDRGTNTLPSRRDEGKGVGGFSTLTLGRNKEEEDGAAQGQAAHRR